VGQEKKTKQGKRKGGCAGVKEKKKEVAEGPVKTSMAQVKPGNKAIGLANVFGKLEKNRKRLGDTRPIEKENALRKTTATKAAGGKTVENPLHQANTSTR